MYEYNPKHKDYMTNEAMIAVIEETQAFIDVLNANVDSIIMNEEVTDDKESITAEKDAEDGKWHVRGSIVNTCTKLDTEFFKLLQNSDQHSEEYRTVLKFFGYFFNCAGSYECQSESSIYGRFYNFLSDRRTSDI